jgi:hypothetical protein
MKQTNYKSAPLKTFYVCASGFERPIYDEMKEKVIKLGGTFYENMMKSTNIVISDKINTSKSLVYT